MNKEEVLKRSRNENVDGDERDKFIKLKRDSFGSASAFIMIIILSIIKICNGQNWYDLACISCAVGIGENIAQLVSDKNEKNGAITGLITAGLLLIVFFIKYIKLI